MIIIYISEEKNGNRYKQPDCVASKIFIQLLHFHVYQKQKTRNKKQKYTKQRKKKNFIANINMLDSILSCSPPK